MIRISKKWTPLHIAFAKQAPLEVVRLLIDKGANVNALTSVREEWLLRLSMLELTLRGG